MTAPDIEPHRSAVVTLGRFLGWASSMTAHSPAAVAFGGSTASRPGSVEHLTRKIDSVSGTMHTSSDEVTDANSGRRLRLSTAFYQPLCARAPHRDLPAGRASSDCSSRCATSAVSKTTVAYDAFGNFRDSVDVAAGSGRRRHTTIAYAHDDVRWLHNQPPADHGQRPRSSKDTPSQVHDLPQRRHQPGLLENPVGAGIADVDAAVGRHGPAAGQHRRQ